MQRVYRTIPFIGALVLATGLAMAQTNERAARGAAGTDKESRFTKDPRLGLSAAQERTVYQSVVNVAGQSLPTGTPLIVGTMMPESVKLTDLPRNVTQQIGAVRPYKFAKLNDGKLLLVDPTNRVVAGIITPSETQRKAPGAGNTGESR